MRGLPRFTQTIENHIADLEKAHEGYEARRQRLDDLRTAFTQGRYKDGFSILEEVCAWRVATPSIVKSVGLYRKALRMLESAKVEIESADEDERALAKDVEERTAEIAQLRGDLKRAENGAAGWRAYAKQLEGPAAPPPPLPPGVPSTAAPSFDSLKNAPKLTLVVDRDVVAMTSFGGRISAEAGAKADALLATPGHTVYLVENWTMFIALTRALFNYHDKALVILVRKDHAPQEFPVRNGVVDPNFYLIMAGAQ